MNGLRSQRRRNNRRSGEEILTRPDTIASGLNELDTIIDAGIAFRTSGCPGKFAEDISACDRPYGDSPPSNIASFPFQPIKKDIKKIRRQLNIRKHAPVEA